MRIFQVTNIKNQVCYYMYMSMILLFFPATTVAGLLQVLDRIHVLLPHRAEPHYLHDLQQQLQGKLHKHPHLQQRRAQQRHRQKL